MKKKILIIIGLFVILVIIFVVVFFLNNFNNKTNKVNDYEVYSNSKSFEYKYSFLKNSENPIDFYTDENNNCTYIRICTYNFKYKPKEKFYESFKSSSQSTELINIDELIKEIVCDKNGKINIFLNSDNYLKIEPVQTGILEGEYEYEKYEYYPEDVSIYLKINNILASQVELNINLKNAIANNPKELRTLEDIAKKYNEYKYQKSEYVSFCSNNKYGLCDINGNIILDFVSDKEVLYNIDKDLLIINKDGLDYLADFSGKIISEGYEDLAFINNISYVDTKEKEYYKDYVIVSEFYEQDKAEKERIPIYAVSNRNWNRQKFGLLEKTGKLVFPVLSGEYYDIFLDAKFCFVKIDFRKYIITDFDGNQIGNNTYSSIMRYADRYYIADLHSDCDFGKDVIINENGEEISDHYSELSMCNSKLLLFKSGAALMDRKILDKNCKVRMEKIGIMNEDRDIEQPRLERLSSKNEFIVDGVTISDLNGNLKLLYIDDEKVTIECEKDGLKKVITIKDGQMVEE